jgi:hypothetical protein
MIGGTVVKVVPLADKVWVNCEEDNSSSQCAIYVERNEKSLKIKPGDCVWWQGGYARWTPYEMRGNVPGTPNYVEGRRCGVDYEIKIPKIGFSGVGPPVKHPADTL